MWTCHTYFSVYIIVTLKNHGNDRFYVWEMNPINFRRCPSLQSNPRLKAIISVLKQYFQWSSHSSTLVNTPLVFSIRNSEDSYVVAFVFSFSFHVVESFSPWEGFFSIWGTARSQKGVRSGLYGGWRSWTMACFARYSWISWDERAGALP